MPYKSEKQRRLMHAKHPQIAARWDAEYGTRVKKGYALGTVTLAHRSKVDRWKKERKASQVKKSAWGVIHKGSPDQSALHIPGTTMTGPKKLRRIKRKRTAEV